MPSPKKKKKIEDKEIIKELGSLISNTEEKINVSKILDKDYAPENDENFWESKNILNFKDFCTSPDHINFPVISPKQIEMAEYMLGTDPKNVFNNKRNVAVLVWGKGCLIGDEVVLTADGRKERIKKLWQENKPIMVFSYDNGSVIPKLSTPPIKKEEKEFCLKIRYSNGMEFICSAGHKILTKRGWINAQDLLYKDEIILPQKINVDTLFDIHPYVSFLYGLSWFEKFDKTFVIVKKKDYKERVLKYIRELNVNYEFNDDSNVLTLPKDFFKINGIKKYNVIPFEILFSSDKSRINFITSFLINRLAKIEYKDNYIILRLNVLTNERRVEQYMEELYFLFNTLGVSIHISKKDLYDYRLLVFIKKRSCKTFIDMFPILNDNNPVKYKDLSDQEQTTRLTYKKPVGLQEVYTFTVPDTHNYMHKLCFHHNSGKDTMSAIIQLYITYILLNMKYPQRAFKMPDMSSLDMINIASSREQSQTVYFEILKRLVMSWEWLKKKWDIVVNGRYFSSLNEDALDAANKVTITNDAILFPKNIRMFSGSSEAESSEGKNPLVFVLDEADAFKEDSIGRSALRIYRTLRTSARSRFGDKFKGFILSYPRSKDGFIMKMYETGKQNLSFYVDKSPTWEVLPKEKFQDKFFEFEGHKIPMDFYEEFMEDPSFSRSAYLCDPPRVENLFIEDISKISNAMKIERQLFEFSNYIADNKVYKDIISAPSIKPFNKYILAFDLGEKIDSSVIALGHKENDKIIVDMITDWKPDLKTNIKVSFKNVEDTIKNICKKVNVVKIIGDHWNSSFMIQNLNADGYSATIDRVNFDNYITFKRFLYSGLIVLPKNDVLYEELKNLQIIASRVDHPEGGHNDMVSACLLLFKNFISVNSSDGQGTNLLSEGAFVSENLNVDEVEGIFNDNDLNKLNIDGFKI